MNIRTLAWKNFARRKGRALFTGLGIFLGIAIFVALSSLAARMEGAARDKLDRFGANILVVPRTEQLVLGFGDVALGGTQVTRARLTAGDQVAIHSIPMKGRLRSVVPFFLAAAAASGKNLVWMGLPPIEIPAARPWWKAEGALAPGKDEVLLGSEAASLLDKGPGGTVTSGGKTFRVAGVLRSTGEKEDGMVIAPIWEVRTLAKSPGAVSFFEVAALCKDCPVEEIVAQIADAVPAARVSAIRQVVESRKGAADQFRRVGLAVSAIVLAIGALMVFVTVMGSVHERTREIGVLRAVGFRRRAILSLLFWETGWVALVSSLAGAALGSAAAVLTAPVFDVAGTAVPIAPAALGVALGTALGLVGAVPPAQRAAALAPTEAIRAL